MNIGDVTDYLAGSDRLYEIQFDDCLVICKRTTKGT